MRICCSDILMMMMMMIYFAPVAIVRLTPMSPCVLNSHQRTLCTRFTPMSPCLLNSHHRTLCTRFTPMSPCLLNSHHRVETFSKETYKSGPQSNRKRLLFPSFLMFRMAFTSHSGCFGLGGLPRLFGVPCPC